MTMNIRKPRCNLVASKEWVFRPNFDSFALTTGGDGQPLLHILFTLWLFMKLGFHCTLSVCL